jgi:hypothetical protein
VPATLAMPHHSIRQERLMIDIGGNPLEALDILFRWGLGWRYLFSSGFRAKVHASWRGRNRWLVLAQVVAGVLFFTTVNYVLAYLIIDLSFYSLGNFAWIRSALPGQR